MRIALDESRKHFRYTAALPAKLNHRRFLRCTLGEKRSEVGICRNDHLILIFAVDTVECLGGELPTAQRRLVEAWAEIHRSELQRDWELLQSGQPPVKIDPLR